MSAYPTVMQLEAWSRAVLAEIDRDIAAGKVPAGIAAFEDLDYFVDRNVYGEATVPESRGDDPYMNLGIVQETVGVWLEERAAKQS